MNPHHQSLQELILAFIFLSGCYVLPVGFTFLLKRFLSRQKNPAVYSPKAFLYLCLPALVYALLESFASRQGLNFLLIIPCMVTIGIFVTLFLKKINPAFVAGVGTLLAIIAWYTVPVAVIPLL